MLFPMKPLRLALALTLAVSLATLSATSRAQSTVYPQQEGFVDAHGVLIYYTAFGYGSPPLVVHGGPGADHTYFLPYVLPLARTHPIGRTSCRDRVSIS